MKSLFMILPVLTFSLGANAKTIACGVGIFRTSGESSQTVEWTIDDFGFSDATLDMQGDSIRMITHPASLANSQIGQNLLSIGMYLESQSAPQGYLISLKGFYFRNDKLTQDFYSLNHPTSGSLALTPRFITAIKKLGKWGQKPFDDVALDHTIASPDVMRSNSMDLDYFLSNGGLDVANEALSKDLISPDEPLVIYMENSCGISQ